MGIVNELNYMRMNCRFEKINLFHEFSYHLLIQEEPGIHCTPCSSCILTVMMP